MSGGSRASEAIIVVTLAIALFAVFFSAFLVVPLAVVVVGLIALAVSQRGSSHRAAEAAPPEEPSANGSAPDPEDRAKIDG